MLPVTFGQMIMHMYIYAMYDHAHADIKAMYDTYTYIHTSIIWYPHILVAVLMAKAEPNSLQEKDEYRLAWLRRPHRPLRLTW